MEITTNSTSDLQSSFENSTLGMNLSGVLDEVTSVRDKERHFRVPGPFDRYIEQIPLIGYPGPIFWIIHGSALVSLTTSFLVSIALISYVCLSHRVKDREQKTTQTTDGETPPETITKSKPLSTSKKRDDSFFKWNIGERLVIYLAVADLTVEFSHIIDHTYIIYNQRNPPDLACSVFGFNLNEFGIAQWVIVLYSALSACSLIVFNKKLHTGRWDWILILSALGAPGSLGILSASLGFLGENGVWCYLDMRTRAGLIYAQVISIVQILLFSAIALSYGAIIIKMRQTTKLIDVNAARYRNSAKMMTIFVVVFIVQWWPLILVNVWSTITLPPDALFIPVVIFLNAGGIYNSIAYTIIRRRLQQSPDTDNRK